MMERITKAVNYENIEALLKEYYIALVMKEPNIFYVNEPTAVFVIRGGQIASLI